VNYTFVSAWDYQQEVMLPGDKGRGAAVSSADGSGTTGCCTGEGQPVLSDN